MDEQKQDDQLEPTYNSSVPIQDVALKTYQEQWTIETVGVRGPGRSVLAARHDLRSQNVQPLKKNILRFNCYKFIQCSLENPPTKTKQNKKTKRTFS